MWAGNWYGAAPVTSDGGGSCPSAATIAAAVMNSIVQGPYSLRDVMRILAAVAAGKTAIVSLGDGAAQVTFRAIDDSGNTVDADMQNSTRIDVTLNP